MCQRNAPRLLGAHYSKKAVCKEHAVRVAMGRLEYRAAAVSHRASTTLYHQNTLSKVVRFALATSSSSSSSRGGARGCRPALRHCRLDAMGRRFSSTSLCDSVPLPPMGFHFVHHLHCFFGTAPYSLGCSPENCQTTFAGIVIMSHLRSAVYYRQRRRPSNI